MGARIEKLFITTVFLSMCCACGSSTGTLTAFNVTLQLISDCSQAGSGAIQCEDLETATAVNESGVWFLEQKEGRTFILTNHQGETIKGVGAFNEDSGDIYQARKYEEEVDTSDGCHNFTDKFYDIVLKDNEMTGALTIAQTGGSELESADCDVLWAHEIKYLVKGTQSDEVVPGR
jgi:hypothetical protein